MYGTAIKVVNAILFVYDLLANARSIKNVMIL
jgi:hypothetical protein